MRRGICVLLGLFVASGLADAAIINYTLTSLGGTSYRYDYTVLNDGSITPNISLFDISFDSALYDESSLTNLSTVPGWDILFLGSGIGIPAAFDAAATSAGVSVGSSLGGVAVSFNWLASGTPGSQPFQIYSPSTFELLGQGTTRLETRVPSVPEPGTLALFGLGLLGLTLRRKGITI